MTKLNTTNQMVAEFDRVLGYRPPVKCPRCDGTGYMCLEDYLDIKDRDGVGPVRAFGCPKCEGLGEIDDEEYDDQIEAVRNAMERS